MGIRGLATYMRDHSSHCLHDYELQNTYLVIDGNNICYRIYDKYVDETSSLFGGDYYAYEQAILNFFDSLLACEVTPLVVFDGADEMLKIGTTLKRCKQRYDSILKGEAFAPLHSLTIFKQALRKKNIRHAQCLFEADKTIAAVAKILKCPVLSNDSDFYMHGSLYIPFDTFGYPVNRSSDNEKVICCKLYDYKDLLNSFKGLNHRTLSLTALILGDEKINLEMLRNLIAQSHGLARNAHIIQKTFNWLSERTIEEAITDILSGIRKSMRQQTLDIIESVINDYTYINLPVEVCGPLSIPEYTMDSTKIYKFKGDIENIPFNRIRCKRRFKTICDNKNELMEIKNMLIAHRNAQNGNDSIISKVPTWFKHEVSTATLPGILLNYIDKHAAVFPVQIEDVKRPTSSLIALNIVRAIYGILSSIVDHKKTCMKYVIRDVNMNLICKELEGTRRIVDLSNLRELPIIKRKDILDDTLGIKDMKCIDELLPEWKLYIACVKYWSDQEKLYKSDKCYAYSIILCILYRICCTTENKGEAHNGEPSCSANIVVVEAYRKIDATNSTSAVQYFTRNSQAPKRIPYKRQVYMSIVHAFAQFQMCLLYAMDLNTLLGSPYEEPLIADLFDGTLLYNLCTDLQAHEDIPKYINQVFKDSPTILAMFNILMLRVDLLLK